MVGEEAGLASLDKVTDGDVEHDNSGMGGSDLGGEFAFDVVAVSVKFGGAVWKSEGNGFGCETPGGSPFGS